MKKGDYVKISRKGERFWVELTKIGPECEGIVDNHLVNTAMHGLSYMDIVKFPKNQIIQHMQESE